MGRDAAKESADSNESARVRVDGRRLKKVLGRHFQFVRRRQIHLQNGFNY